jgi:uncharacterized SAM-binding protein YcdF (DUF218 family)
MMRFLAAMILVALAYGLAFFFWVSTLPPTSTIKPDTDGIVVLTGGEPRLDIAVSLLESGVGKRLLISGVSPTTSRESVKQVSGGKTRFDCCTDIGYAADTRGNAEEAAEWAHRHQFHSVTVVTARYHMPRTMHEFSRAMPDVTLLPYPVDQDGIDLSGWWLHPQTVQLLNREFAKYLGSLATGLIPA